jgi:hypothetical protein
MKDKDALRYECQRHLDRRPIRRQESGPVAWLVITDGPSVNIDTGETQWSHVRVLPNGFRDFVAGFLRAIRLPIWNN